jgi:MarR family transcriptional regulator, organic hydroperoxide resistance regulator
MDGHEHLHGSGPGGAAGFGGPRGFGGPGGHPDPIDLQGVDPTSAGVLTAFRRQLHLNRQLFMRLAAGKGGHPGRTVVLGMLKGHDGIAQRDLADKLHLARPTITIMLQKMEHEGLIERWDDPDDQRLTRIRLTDAGRAQATDLGDAYKEGIDATIGTLTEAERLELTRLLELLNERTASALKELDA